MAVKIAKGVFIFSIIFYIALLIFKPKLPSLSHIQDTILKNNPIQKSISTEPIKTSYGNFTYDITPLYSYDIYGLVVSEYTSHNWLDVTHKKDPANTRDICLVWGDNIKSEAYQKVRYKHGEFTCYYSYSQQINPPFNGALLSNNHLIPKNEDVEKKIASVKIGDQIRIIGYLANYKITDEDGRESGWRNTSTIREDTRNGACEIIYVDEIAIIKRGNGVYYALKETLPVIIITIFIVSLIKFLFF